MSKVDVTYNMNRISQEIGRHKSRSMWLIFGLFMTTSILGSFGVGGFLGGLIVVSLGIGIGLLDGWMQKRRLEKMELVFVEVWVDGVKAEVEEEDK